MSNCETKTNLSLHLHLCRLKENNKQQDGMSHEEAKKDDSQEASRPASSHSHAVTRTVVPGSVEDEHLANFSKMSSRAKGSMLHVGEGLANMKPQSLHNFETLFEACVNPGSQDINEDVMEAFSGVTKNMAKE